MKTGQARRAYIAVMCVAGLMASSPKVRAADDVSLAFTQTADSIYRINGSFVTLAPRRVIWSVLTDYDGIDRFVTSMRESHVRRRDSDSLLVEQAAVVRLFLFSRTVHLVLDVRETPYESIRFVDIRHRDLRSYHGSWELHDVPGGIRVDYAVTAGGDFDGAGFFAKRGVTSTARSLLREVRAEVVRRAALAAAADSLPATGAAPGGFSGAR